MSLPKVLNLKNSGGCDVYIGRPSKWGNPYRIGRDGSRLEVIAMYEMYMRDQIRRGVITVSELKALQGKTLGCYCVPEPCHGDVLVKLVKEVL